MIHGLTTASTALIDRLSHTLQKHPKRITAAIAAVLLTGGGGAFAVASFAPDPAELPVRMVTLPVESLAENLVLGQLESPGFSLYRSEQVATGARAVENLAERSGISSGNSLVRLQRPFSTPSRKVAAMAILLVLAIGKR